MYLSIDRLRQRLRFQYEKLGTWDKVAVAFGVSKGVVYRTATSDYEPKASTIRNKLGLAPICQNCGELVDIP